MSDKSIYDEVLKSLNKYYDKKSVEYLDQQDNLIKQDYGDWWLLDFSDYHKIKKALEQAQKQEKLLKLYKKALRLNEYINDHLPYEEFESVTGERIHYMSDAIKQLEQAKTEIKELEK